MSYVFERPRWEGSDKMESVLDLKRFAADLAKAMGGKLVPLKPDAFPSDSERYMAFTLNDDVKISLSAGYGKNDVGKVTVGIDPIGPRYPYDRSSRDGTKLPDAKISVDRPMDALVKDITRRVIEPAKEPIKKIRDAATKRTNDIAAMKAAAATMKAKGFVVNLKDDETYMGEFYAKGIDFSGRFYASGRVDIKSMDGLTPDLFDKIVKARGTRKEKES